MPDFMIAIVLDNDHDPEGSTTIPEIADEESEKIGSGEWSAYGVGLARETSVGYFEPDYSTFVWGSVADAGYEGLYADTGKIQDAFLRSTAEDQVSQFGEE